MNTQPFNGQADAGPDDVTGELALPQVQRTGAGQINLTLDLRQGRVLARLLAHYSVLSSASADQLLHKWMLQDPANTGAPALGSVEGYDPQLWTHTMVTLLAELSLASTPPAPLVLVPAGIPAGTEQETDR